MLQPGPASLRGNGQPHGSRFGFRGRGELRWHKASGRPEATWQVAGRRSRRHSRERIGRLQRYVEIGKCGVEALEVVLHAGGRRRRRHPNLHSRRR